MLVKSTIQGKKKSKKTKTIALKNEERKTVGV
jgi:hypothetical protein